MHKSSFILKTKWVIVISKVNPKRKKNVILFVNFFYFRKNYKKSFQLLICYRKRRFRKSKTKIFYK